MVSTHCLYACAWVCLRIPIRTVSVQPTGFLFFHSDWSINGYPRKLGQSKLWKIRSDTRFVYRDNGFSLTAGSEATKTQQMNTLIYGHSTNLPTLSANHKSAVSSYHQDHNLWIFLSSSWKLMNPGIVLCRCLREMTSFRYICSTSVSFINHYNSYS